MNQTKAIFAVATRQPRWQSQLGRWASDRTQQASPGPGLKAHPTDIPIQVINEKCLILCSLRLQNIFIKIAEETLLPSRFPSGVVEFEEKRFENFLKTMGTFFRFLSLKVSV